MICIKKRIRTAVDNKSLNMLTAVSTNDARLFQIPVNNSADNIKQFESIALQNKLPQLELLFPNNNDAFDFIKVFRSAEEAARQKEYVKREESPGAAQSELLKEAYLISGKKGHLSRKEQFYLTKKIKQEESNNSIQNL